MSPKDNKTPDSVDITAVDVKESEDTMSESVGTAIQDEIKRNYELLALYKEIPTGVFGAVMIQQDLDFAHQALKENDVVKILQAYNKLKDNE